MPRLIGLKNEQIMVTIPRKLVIALDLKKGERVQFKINNKGNLELIRCAE